MTEELIIYTLLNLVSSVLSGASGGGGAFVSTPLMVLLGLSPAQAIATAKFGGLGMSLGASSRFFREKLTDKRTVIIFSVLGAIAAIAGSLTLNHFKDYSEVLENIMGFAILAIGIPALYIRNAGLETRQTSARLRAIGLPLLTLAVFMQVALGAGIGGLQMIVLISCFGMTALVANATRRAMQLVVACVSLAIFIATGLVDYRFGTAAFLTALIGGYIGAHLAIKKGNKFVINLFAIVSGLMALQLLLN